MMNNPSLGGTLVIEKDFPPDTARRVKIKEIEKEKSDRIKILEKEESEIIRSLSKVTSASEEKALEAKKEALEKEKEELIRCHIKID